MRMRLNPDQRKAMILADATRMLRETGTINMGTLAETCRCARSTILYHFGSTDELRRRAQHKLENNY